MPRSGPRCVPRIVIRKATPVIFGNQIVSRDAGIGERSENPSQPLFLSLRIGAARQSWGFRVSLPSVILQPFMERGYLDVLNVRTHEERLPLKAPHLPRRKS